MAKQPAVIFQPPAEVEVATLLTIKLLTEVVAAERLPEKVEVELVPETVRNPCMVDVPVVLPWRVEVAVPPTYTLSKTESRVVEAWPVKLARPEAVRVVKILSAVKVLAE